MNRIDVSLAVAVSLICAVSGALASMIAITNPAAIRVTVPHAQTQYHIVAANDGIAGEIGVIVNHRITNWYAAANPCSVDVSLRVGANLVTLVGTNSAGEKASDTVYIVRRNEAGRLLAWGNNGWNQTNCPTGGGFVDIAAGSMSCVALKSDGSLTGWTSWALCPVGNDFVAVACGSQFAAALRADGTVVTWGYWTGQTECPTESDFVDIDADADHVLALHGNGMLSGWGNNVSGQSTCPEGHNVLGMSAGFAFNVEILWNGGPVVNITNEDGAVRYDVSSYAASGTNNGEVVGGMWISNVLVGGASVSFPAAAAWTAPPSHFPPHQAGWRRRCRLSLGTTRCGCMGPMPQVSPSAPGQSSPAISTAPS